MAYIDNPNVTLDWAKSFKRTGNFPLDYSSIFASYDDAVAYAKLDGTDSRSLGKTGYVGQIIVVYSDEEVAAYLIVAAGKLMKLAETDPDYSNPDEAIDALKSQLQGVADRVTDLEEKNSPTRDEFTILSGKVETNTDDIASVTSDVAELQNTIKGLNKAMHFIGVSSTDPAKEAAQVEGVSSFNPGDVIIYGQKEFVYDGSKWIELGDESSFATTDYVDTTFAKQADFEQEKKDRSDADSALGTRISTLEGAGYVTEETANDSYVHQEAGKELIPSTDLSKLAGMKEIKVIGDGLSLDDSSKTLSVSEIEQSKVKNLTSTLNNKAESTTVNGIRTDLGTKDDAKEVDTAFGRIAKVKEDLATEVGDSIKSVKVNGVALGKSANEVNISVAGDGVLGVVKSAKGENNVSVDGEGVMSVASVNVKTLVQTDGEYLTLDGGNAGLTPDQD